MAGQSRLDLDKENNDTDGLRLMELVVTQSLPIIVGVGQEVIREFTPADTPSPLSLAVSACKRALEDSGVSGLATAIDTLAFVRLNSDSIRSRSGPFGRYTNLPRLLAQRIGADPTQAILSPVGGQSPQQLVNEIANNLFNGTSDVALVAGAEAIGAMKAAMRAGKTLAWDDATDGQLEDRGIGPELINAAEIAGGMGFPPQVYGAFEHAWRAHNGLTQSELATHMAELFAPFSTIASTHRYAQYPTQRSVNFLQTESKDNYRVADPYLKWHVAQDAVNQAAALIITHEVKARELGIAEERWVYLHGGADTQDKLVSRRPALHRSAAMASATSAALTQSGVAIDDIDHLELYSCFPCAVQFALEGLGISGTSRQLTQTGGLPYFGGAGNNYSMHGIASMVDTLRADPGSRGLVLANGGFLSKASSGIYSTKRPDIFTPIDSRAAQTMIDAEPDIEPAHQPTRGRVEAYSVLYQRGQPLFAYAFMRSDSGHNAQRFLARTDTNDVAGVERFLKSDPIHQEFGVEPSTKRNQLVT